MSIAGCTHSKNMAGYLPVFKGSLLKHSKVKMNVMVIFKINYRELDSIDINLNNPMNQNISYIS